MQDQPGKNGEKPGLANEDLPAFGGQYTSPGMKLENLALLKKEKQQKAKELG